VRPVSFTGSGGLNLVGEERGHRGDPLAVLLHGGGQTLHSWGNTADVLAAGGWHAVSLDARGHGRSDWSPGGDYRLVSFASDVKHFVEGTSNGPPFLIGASLGGLTSILLAGEVAPGIAAGIVLVDIVPDMEPAGADRIREFMSANTATGFASLDEVAEAIAVYNPHRPRPTDLSGLTKNLRQRNGRWYWHWDPAFIDPSTELAPSEITDTARMHRAVDAIVDRGTPVMLLRGRTSDLVTPEKAAAFCDRYPTVEFVDISGAGHMVAGDRNDAFTEAVADFLDRRRPPTPSGSIEQAVTPP
jgi:peroxiredoxin